MTNTKTIIGNGYVRSFTGSVHGDEYIAGVERTQASEDYDRLRFVINDFTNAIVTSDWYHNVSYIAALTNAARSYNPYLRLAYVTQDEEFSNIVAKEFKSCGHTSEEFAIFRTVDAAKEWAMRPLSDTHR